ncbi:MAG: DUF2208 family protein [Thermoproteota archaeon]
MAYQSKRSFMANQLYSQVMIVVFAVLNTYYPEYLNLTFILFVALSFVLLFIRQRSQLKERSLKQFKEIGSSRKVHEEDSTEVMRLMALDNQLVEEMKPLTRSMFLSLFVILVSLAWYYLYFDFTRSLVRDASLTGVYMFLVFLAGYEVPYLLMTSVSLNQNRALKNFVQIPRQYALFESGLTGQGMTIRFPMDNYDVKLDSKRKFVELVSKDEQKPARIRLYSSKADDLFELIMKYGLSRS